MSDKGGKNPSGATHLAMVACILIGVFAYVGWKLKTKETATGTSGFTETTNEDDSALSVSATARDLQQAAAHPAAQPATPEPRTPALPAAPAAPTAPNLADLTNLLPGPSTPTVSETPATPAQPQETMPDFDPDPIGDRAPHPQAPIIPRVIEEAIPERAPEPVARPAMTSTPSDNTLTHTVQSGETLSMLAERYLGTRARAVEIFNANRNLLPSPDMLAVGMKLKIPGAVKGEAPLTHTITSGDTLPSLAIRYYGKVTPEIIALMRDANPALRSGGFKVGTILVIPLQHPQTSTTGTTQNPRRQANTPHTDTQKKIYVVQSGDTLSKIASKLYRDNKRWRDIYNKNRSKLPSPNKLYVGMKLQLP